MYVTAAAAWLSITDCGPVKVANSDNLMRTLADIPLQNPRSGYKPIPFIDRFPGLLSCRW